VRYAFSMCGRATRRNPYAIQKSYAGLSFAKVQDRLKPTYNMAPRQQVLGVASDAPQTATWLSWGLLPVWAKSWKDGSRCIQAQAETVATKPSYRSAWKNMRRCALIVDGYIEWTTSGGKKWPHLFEVEHGQPFALAGLWEDWRRPADDPHAGEVLRTATVLTVPANSVVEPINDRMPVILLGDDLARWLTCGLDEATQMMKPLAAEKMNQFAINPMVNKVGVDQPECVQPYEQPHVP